MSRNPARGLRLPPAVQVFPSLRDAIRVRPRRLAAVPIGGNNTGAPPRPEDVTASLRHVYHDLGVLAFAGLNNAQIAKVGDVLATIAKHGGIGSLVTASDWRSEAKKIKLPPPEEGDLWPAADWKHAGILKSRTLLTLAEELMPQAIESLLRARMPDRDPSRLQLRERGVFLKGNPAPQGVLHATVEGTRVLPLEAHVAAHVDPKFGNLYVRMALFAGGGRGSHAGSVTVDYTLLREDKARGQMRTLWVPRDGEDGKSEGDVAEQREKAEVVKTDILEPLWELERETYADRAQELVDYTPVKVGSKRGNDKLKSR